MSPTELTKVRDVLARALSVEAVNQLGRDTGQAVRLRTVTGLFLAVVKGGAKLDHRGGGKLDHPAVEWRG